MLNFIIIVLWLSYGVFNSSQHDYYKDCEGPGPSIFMNILFAPVALVIRIFRGIFYWEGTYED